MANPYADGNFAWYWYQSWLPVIAAVGTLGMLIYIFNYPLSGLRGAISKVVGVVAFLGTLPMSQERIGIGVDVLVESMFVLSILGLFVAALNVYYHVISRRVSDGQDSFADEGYDFDETITQSGADPGLRPYGGDASHVVPGLEQPPAFLLVKSGPQAGTSIPISQAETMIGRSSEADIVFDDELVSREHANITYSDGEFRMTDSGSASGTIVNGVAGETVVLNSGAELKIGNTEIVFVQDESTLVSGKTDTGADPGETIISTPTSELLMKWVAVVGGPAKGTTVQIKAGRTTVGRESFNDVQIPDSTVSREHAVILADGDELRLIDLGSVAGTSVDGTPVAGGKVEAGDVITIGQNTMSLVSVNSPAAADLATAANSDETVIIESNTPGVSAVLVVQSGPDAGKSYQLTEGENLVGRDAGSQVLLSDESASRRHAILRKRGDAYAIYDLGSSLGTRVNDSPVEGELIGAGQELKFGNSVAVIMDPSASL